MKSQSKKMIAFAPKQGKQKFYKYREQAIIKQGMMNYFILDKKIIVHNFQNTVWEKKETLLLNAFYLMPLLMNIRKQLSNNFQNEKKRRKKNRIWKLDIGRSEDL